MKFLRVVVFAPAAANVDVILLLMLMLLFHMPADGNLM